MHTLADEILASLIYFWGPLKTILRKNILDIYKIKVKFKKYLKVGFKFK